MKFLKDGFSIDEMKVSVLVLCLIAVVAIGGYGYISSGDITSNWLTLTEFFIASVAGVNAVGLVSNAYAIKSRNIMNNKSYKDDVSDEIKYQEGEYREIKL